MTRLLICIKFALSYSSMIYAMPMHTSSGTHRCYCRVSRRSLLIMCRTTTATAEKRHDTSTATTSSAVVFTRHPTSNLLKFNNDFNFRVFSSLRVALQFTSHCLRFNFALFYLFAILQWRWALMWARCAHVESGTASFSEHECAFFNNHRARKKKEKGKNENLFILGFRVVVARICLPLCQCRLQSSHKLSYAIQTDTQKTMSNFTTFFRRAQCLRCPTNRFAHFMHTNYTRIHIIIK